MDPNERAERGDKSTICLGFDYGTRRIGVAVGDLALGTARPLRVVSNHHGTVDWIAIDGLLDEWRPGDLVIGWPTLADGDAHPLWPHISGFTRRLKRHTDCPIWHTDEAYSSNAAQDLARQLRQRGQWRRRTRREDIDTLSATLILEDWMRQRRDIDS